MKDDEIELIVQLLLESRTCAYIEWLDNKLIMAANNNINKDSLLALLNFDPIASRPLAPKTNLMQ